MIDLRSDTCSRPTAKSKLTIAIATAVLAALGGTAVYAQNKYSLKSPSGIAFSDFKGYKWLRRELFQADPHGNESYIDSQWLGAR